MTWERTKAVHPWRARAARLSVDDANASTCEDAPKGARATLNSTRQRQSGAVTSSTARGDRDVLAVVTFVDPSVRAACPARPNAWRPPSDPCTRQMPGPARRLPAVAGAPTPTRPF
ncbi:unnamed protein product [Lampetra fluviatilis]